MRGCIVGPTLGLGVLAGRSQPRRNVEPLTLTVVQTSIGDTSILDLLAS